jgi:hypothetical protein
MVRAVLVVVHLGGSLIIPSSQCFMSYSSDGQGRSELRSSLPCCGMSCLALAVSSCSDALCIDLVGSIDHLCRLGLAVSCDLLRQRAAVSCWLGNAHSRDLLLVPLGVLPSICGQWCASCRLNRDCGSAPMGFNLTVQA